MENIPPSYESAIARNPWQIVAPYIPSAELCALNRVSRRLNEVFAPCLWGNPASHFGTENDRVYVALTRFKRTLKRVRLSVRELTHTLHLPPAQSELYDGPHSEWLRDVLEQLPKLQSLVVSRLPFFDHMALLSLRNASDDGRILPQRASFEFSLRLLIAAGCQNTTSQGLAGALKHFPHLAVLDLSKTLAARDRNVLSRLKEMPLLQALKLRSIYLRDHDMEILAEAIGTRVRSLDVQGNYLTDHSVRILLSTCFQTTTGTAYGSSNSELHALSNLALEDWPSGFVRPDSAVLDELKDASYDERLVRRLTSGNISRLPYEDMPVSGITHLNIADNNLTVEGLASLVRSTKLHVLDAGSLNHGTILTRPRSPSFTSTAHPHDDNRHVRIPGVEKLRPVLAHYGGEMTSLRLNHALLTEDAPSNLKERLNTCKLSAEEIPTPELDGPMYAPPAELDAMPPLYEPEHLEPVPCFELPGDSIHFAVSAAVGEKPMLTKEESQPENKGDGAFVPEVVTQVESDVDEPPLLNATGLIGASNDASSPNLPKETENDTKEVGTSQNDAMTQAALFEKQRQEVRISRLDKSHGLIPGMMPKLRTLTLIDVPTHTRSPKVHQALIQFIRDCASETELAIHQACLEPTCKPGERQSLQIHHNAREIFALRQIILEMAPAVSLLSPQSAKKPSFTRDTRSSTEDADSEALWTAAENDFTFFDDDEECGLPSVETDPHVPCSALSEKITMPGNGSRMNQLPLSQRPSQKDFIFDVVHELAQFRKERRIAFGNAIERGVRYVEGYWPGEVKIVRRHHGGGKTDYYGNQFGKTGVYR